MNKRTLSVYSDDLKDYLSGCTLAEALLTLQGWIQQYGADAKLTIGEECTDYYGDKEYAYVKVVSRREETDEEYSQRTTKENAQKLAQEERDRAGFQRLQAKFGEKK